MQRTKSFAIFPILLLVTALAAVVGVAWASASTTQEMNGTAGGSVRATQWGVSSSGACMGWVPRDPQHRFQLDVASRVDIRVRSHTDTTLALVTSIDGKTKSWCNDDADGSNPGLSTVLPAGSYGIYIGTWDAGDRVPYALALSIAPN